MNRRLAALAIALLSLPVLGTAHAERVFVYPKAGQDQAQQQRDEGECAAWAQAQTDFDPRSPPSRDQLVAQAQSASGPGGGGGQVAAGMAAGAVKGSAIGYLADKNRTGLGTAGAFIGGMRAARRVDQQAAQGRQQAEQAADAQLAAMRDAYDRAFAACLEARDYTVK